MRPPRHADAAPCGRRRHADAAAMRSPPQLPKTASAEDRRRRSGSLQKCTANGRNNNRRRDHASRCSGTFLTAGGSPHIVDAPA